MICSEANDMGDELSLKSGFLDNEYLSVMEYLIPFQIIAYLGARDLGLSTIHALKPILLFPILPETAVYVYHLFFCFLQQ